MTQDWIPTAERPLFIINEKGWWECTEDGMGMFLAAVPYQDSKQPNKELWWIKLCVVEDEIGLCVVGDDDNEPAGWHLSQVTHFIPCPKPPKPEQP